jgi:hypothetical protein
LNGASISWFVDIGYLKSGVSLGSPIRPVPTAIGPGTSLNGATNFSEDSTNGSHPSNARAVPVPRDGAS